MNEKLECIITFGLPASGKSTFINSIVTNKDTLIISADQIKKEFSGYTDENHAEFFKKAVVEAELRVYNYSKSKKNFIFDTGSINTNYSKRIINHLKENNYEITLIVFNTPVDICIERDKNRPQSVGEQVIREKAARAPQCLWDLIHMVNNVVSYSLVEGIIL